MTDGARWFLVVTAIAFILGLRGSIRLHRRYVDVARQLVRRERLLLASIVGVSWTITAAAGYFAIVSARRIAGWETLEWTPLVSLIVATAILFIPAALDYVVGLVARVPWR